MERAGTDSRNRLSLNGNPSFSPAVLRISIATGAFAFIVQIAEPRGQFLARNISANRVRARRSGCQTARHMRHCNCVSDPDKTYWLAPYVPAATSSAALGN